jgi:teichuronic acid biosynthesis glycosyltransferase TuaC
MMATPRDAMIAELCGRFLQHLDRRGWITWERAADDSRILMVTNAWPEPESATRGIFLRHTVDGLDAAGVNSDILYVRGYRGPHCYLLGCMAMAVIPLAKPAKYQVVHSHAGETALVARFFHGAPVLASYWGSDLLGPRAGSRRTRLKSALVSRTLRLHSLLMTATTTKSTQMELVLPRRARRRNWVIPDGVNRSLFRPMDRESARRSLGWPVDEVVVISVGRRVALKRLDLAEQAAAMAAEQVRGLRWRSISDVAPEDMPRYYNAADLLLHTSASEGSPNAVKEALACDLPVVATPAGDIAELLDGVEPSALCPPDPESLARAITRCLSEGSRSNGRERTEHLSVERVTARTLECYRSLGADVRPSPA